MIIMIHKMFQFEHKDIIFKILWGYKTLKRVTQLKSASRNSVESILPLLSCPYQISQKYPEAIAIELQTIRKKNFEFEEKKMYF